MATSTTGGNDGRTRDRLGPSDNPEEWEDNPDEWEDEEFEEFTQLMMGSVETGSSNEPEQDVVDQLHAVVRQVTKYDPPLRKKERRLPTIGFIQ